MKDRIHIAVSKEDKETLAEWARQGDRSVSKQFSRIIRKERERRLAIQEGHPNDFMSDHFRKDEGKEDLDS
tara:strand:- start:26 stop:238 length:213 start_codon:yes stop_codon:yes gene_type:complete